MRGHAPSGKIEPWSTAAHNRDRHQRPDDGGVPLFGRKACLVSVVLRSPVPPAGGVPALDLVEHRRAPILEALWAYRAAGTVPFSTPGHKLGAGASKELRALIGDEVFAADVWLNAGDAAAAVLEAEEL